MLTGALSSDCPRCLAVPGSPCELEPHTGPIVGEAGAGLYHQARIERADRLESERRARAERRATAIIAASSPGGPELILSADVAQRVALMLRACIPHTSQATGEDCRTVGIFLRALATLTYQTDSETIARVRIVP